MSAKRKKAAVWLAAAGLGIALGLLFREPLSVDWLHFLHAGRQPTDTLVTRPLIPGDRVIGFAAGTRRIEYGGGEPRRVFLFFSSDCPYCGAQLPGWARVVSALRATDMEVIALGIEGRDLQTEVAYLARSGLDGVEVLFPPRQVLDAYRLWRTPMTLVIDGKGTVERNWIGVWDDADILEAADVLAIDLPISAPPLARSYSELAPQTNRK